MTKRNVEIYVATHKEYSFPNDEMYIPIMVGAAMRPKNELKYMTDDSGQNISNLNSNFNELTALYWIWKNCDASIVGLEQYRRYLVGKQSRKNSFNNLLTRKDIDILMRNVDMILPSPRNYVIESNYSHYIHAHEKAPIEKLKIIMNREYSKYYPALLKVLGKRKAHMFNMFIMKKQPFQEYCDWLFGVLFKLKEEVDISDYTQNEQRVFGFISELLLDVWIETNNYKYAEVGYWNVEGEHWLKKGSKFLLRKFGIRNNSHMN